MLLIVVRALAAAASVLALTVSIAAVAGEPIDPRFGGVHDTRVRTSWPEARRPHRHLRPLAGRGWAPYSSRDLIHAYLPRYTEAPLYNEPPNRFPQR